MNTFRLLILVGCLFVSFSSEAATALRCEFSDESSKSSLVVTLTTKKHISPEGLESEIQIWRQDNGDIEYFPVHNVDACSHCLAHAVAINDQNGVTAMITSPRFYYTDPKFSGLISEDNRSARSIYTKQGYRKENDKYQPFSDTMFGWCAIVVSND